MLKIEVMNKIDKVFVTGASGHLGRKLIPEMIKRGYRIKAQFRSQEKADKYCPEGIEQAFGDLTRPGWLNSAMMDCDQVIHCAAYVKVQPLSDKDTATMRAVNVEGTRYVVESCRKAGIKRLLYISTIGAVGASTDDTPITEEAAFNIGGYDIPYFDTKYEAEQIVLEAANDLEIVIVNPSIIVSLPDKDRLRKKRRKLPRWLPAYFDFGLNLVDSRDVIEGAISALEKGHSGHRYLLTGDNLNPESAFAITRQYFGIGKPLIKLPYIFIYALGFLTEIYYRFKGKAPKFNRNFARLAKFKFYYDCTKAKTELGYNPRSFEETIKEIITYLQ